MYEIFYYLIAMVASYFIQAALATKPPPPEAAVFADFDFPQADEGTPHTVYFGDNWSGGWMVLDVGNYRYEAIESGGGKK